MILRVTLLLIGVSVLYNSVSAVTSPHIAADFPSHKNWNGGHLQTRPVYKGGSDSSLAQRIARWFWSPDSDDDDYDEGGHRPLRVKVNSGPKPPLQNHQGPQIRQIPQNHPTQQNHQLHQNNQVQQNHPVQASNPPSEKKVEQSKSIKGSSSNLFQFWASPNQKQSSNSHSNSNSGYRYGAGRSKDNCNPCNEFPWVPVARSLPMVPAILANHGNDQYSLTIPAVSLHYGPPNSQSSSGTKPIPSYAAPPPQQHQPQQQQHQTQQQHTQQQHTQQQQQYHQLKQQLSQPNSSNKPSQSFSLDFGGKPPPPPPPPPSSSSSQSTYIPAAPQKTRLPPMTYGIPIDIAKIPLTYASPSANNYPVQQTSYSSNVPKKVNAPALIHPPIPFPALSHGALPPLHPPQPFTSAKANSHSGGLSAYLRPPAAPAGGPAPITQSHSLSSSDHGDCGKCRPSSTYAVEDSVAASAQHQETGHKIQAIPNTPAVEVMKSVPVAEYISSIEYPMQIVQAPIVDINGLPQYFNLQFPTQNGQSFLQHSGHALFVNHALNTNDISSDASNPSTTPQPADNIISASSYKNQLQSQEKSVGKSSSLSSTIKQDSSTVTTTSPKTTSYYTSAPDLLPPLQDPPQQFFNGYNTSSLEQQSNTQINGVPPSSMRYLNPPPLTPTQSTLNWITGSTISSTQIHSSTPTNQPRFSSTRPSIPPSTQASKRPKQIHQIIVPYTTRNVKGVSNANEPGWTPVPPQARKVPQPIQNFRIEVPQQTRNISFGDIHGLQLGGTEIIKSIPLSATGSENVGQFKIPGIEEGLTPELISQLLKLEDGNNHNSLRAMAHPGDIHHVVAANLRALLRGEEDAVDFNRLQKNIDNWTAEGYKTNAPPENFQPLTTLSHLSPSKNIPEEYFTTPSIFTSNSNDDEVYETSGSQNHPVRSILKPHTKDNQDSASDNYNSWSLLDTKLKATVITTQVTPTVSETTPSTTEVPKLKKNIIKFHPQAVPFNSQQKTASLASSTQRLTPSSTTTESTVIDTTQPTSKAWEQLQVSISPLTKEKVYVVTPQPVDSGEPTTATDTSEQSTMSISSTRVDKTYSVETARRTTRYLHDGIESQTKTQAKAYTLKPNRPTLQYTNIRRAKGSPSTLKDSSETLDPINRSNFGVKQSSDDKGSRSRRMQDEEGYFRFFPELMKASDIGEEAEVDQVRRVALELKKEGST
ncbi:flocculation protein FLO11-like [Nilaparvata lugens]|uniref:flocculation protein FLO11-like n=1 Tax=Nilaparvata lugens TaxID=108931 RepID=UPI00193DCA85|nr:flocculation protein FLO11-like [Nilaparvata lugens]